jgi:hypothetical protein
MIFDDIPDGAAVFIDANTLVFHFTAHPKYGSGCARLLKRIEQSLLQAFVSSHVLSDTSHRLMTVEAMNHFNWPAAGLAARWQRNSSHIPQLRLHRQALHKIIQIGIRVLPVSGQHIIDAADVASMNRKSARPP